MANTFVKIQTVTVGSGGAASIDFTSIPQTYTNLKIIISGRSTRATTDDDYIISFNSSTTGLSTRFLYGNGSATASSTAASGFAGSTSAANSTASVFGNAEIYIPNYTSSSNKSYSVDTVTENNATLAYQNIVAGLWSNTAAITSINVKTNVGSFVQYSTATLYGIKSS